MNKRIELASDTIEQRELDSLSNWVKTNQKLTQGPLCLEFEKEFAKWQGSKYAVCVNSGSSANLLVAQSLLEGGYLRNKVAIVPAVSWVTTVTPFMQLGFDVQLCDCDIEDLGFDLTHFEELCKKHQPSVAILVHVLGHANKLAEIQKICAKYDVLLVEDSCESLGSVYGDKKVGSHGKAGCFSFYYGHHISTIEGGMIVTDDYNLYNTMISVRSHGWSRGIDEQVKKQWSEKYDIDEFRDLYTFYHSGFNLRSTDLNAFIGLSQLKKLDDICNKRAENFVQYTSKMTGFWQQKSDTKLISSFAYATLVENRMEVYQHMNKHGVDIRPLICGNIGLHPFWIKKYGACNLPNADIIHYNGLYLPNHYNLTIEDINYTCSKFNEIAIPKTI